MPAAILSPQTCSPAELDRYLASGWRPLGQRIYISDFVQLELGEIFSVIPTRLPLDQHAWRKGQRKLLRKNKSAFRWEIVPAKIDEAKLSVNERYLQAHPTKSTDTLDIHLVHEGRNIFSTYECNIYLGEELVAFSFFDLGKSAVYSKAGIYDPVFQTHSLGLFSMYLEIEWCIERGLKHYYPGYISPDNSLFDYKKRVGSLEFWNMPNRKWLPLTDFDNQQHGPYQLLLKRSKELLESVLAANKKAFLYQYVFFELRMMDDAKAKNLLGNPFLLLLDLPANQQVTIAIYNLEVSSYQCWTCSYDRIFTFFEQPNTEFEIFRYVLDLDELLFQAENSAKFIEAFEQFIGSKPQKI